jgi:hypothetical protein
MTQPPAIPVATTKKSTLATLSLVFSCCSILTPFFAGTIGGIICGHLAMKELKRTPGLEGRRQAKWGLIIGYSSILVIPLLCLGFLFLFGGSCGGGLFGH